MYTRSIIQQRIEENDLQNNFKEILEGLENRYNIEDSIFTRDGREAKEAVKGYFVPDSPSLSSLSEALFSSSPYPHTVRIINNEKYITGTVYESLSLVPDSASHVYDIAAEKEVR